MSKYQMGAITVLTLVALRVGIGWHFFKEGAKKIQSGNFKAAGFLHQATGPLAPYMKDTIPDRLGKQRLNRETVLADWKKYVDQAKSHYGFDDQQAKQADAARGRWSRELTTWFRDNKEDLHEYFHQVDRLDRLSRDTALTSMTFYGDWYGRKPAEWRSKMNGWLAQVNGMSSALQSDIYDVATPQQQEKGILQLPDRSKTWIDKFVMYSIFGIGACLILGLFTRLAALGGICFLGSVMATQPFWVPTADLQYSYYQGVEILALLLLAAIGAGRFAGLDFLLSALRMRCCPPKTGDQA